MLTVLDRPFHPRALLWASLPWVLFLVPSLLSAADTARVSGSVYTVGSDQVQVVWPNARVTLKNTLTKNAISTITNERGTYVFSGVEPGQYEITVSLATFETELRQVKLTPKADVRVNIGLRPKRRTDEIVVSAQTEGVDTTTTDTSSRALTQDTLQSAPLLNERFQDALPLLPGVIRGPDGLLNIKGGRADQAGTIVNAASAVDPVTGQAAISLPLEAVGSARVLSNPFSTEYGRFAGGIVELETLGGTDQWKFQLRSFIPRMRMRNGSIVGIESIRPRLTVAGPIKRGKLHILQSFDYKFVRIPVPSLPDFQNEQVTETFDSRTQLDWNITPNHHFTGGVSVYPQNLSFTGMNTFNPMEVASSYRQRGYFISLSERSIFTNGGYLTSMLSVKRFDTHVFPALLLDDELDLFPEQNFGAYFHRQDRESHLYQWSQTYHVRPVKSRGVHLFLLGYSYARSQYDGTVANLPVLVLREPTTPGADCAQDPLHTICSLSQRITYGPQAALSAVKNDFAFFFLDVWQIVPRFSLSYGVRLDRDDLSQESINAAPRVGFVFAPTRDNKTAIRGGIGLFYDKVPLNVATFPSYPAQTITRYAADGTTVVDGPTTFAHTIATPDGKLRVPYSLGWNLQIDRQLTRQLLFRFGYEQRETHRDFLVEPSQNGSTGQLRLLNSARQRYREFQWTLRWRANQRTMMFFTYVRSRATGDLNTFEQYFGNFPNPIIRANEFGLLPYDAPNRFVASGTIGLPLKVEFSPVLEVRDGFPFSAVDNDLNFVGPRNGAGRFPALAALDVLIARKFPLRLFKRKVIINAGMRVYNLTQHNNPRDVQRNVFSPNFGQFYNSVPHQFRARFEFEF